MVFLPSPTILKKEWPPITFFVPKYSIDGLATGSYYVTVMAKSKKSWSSMIKSDEPRDYLCAYCGNQVGSEKYYVSNHRDSGKDIESFIYLCPRCVAPTYFDEQGMQFPSSAFGEYISDIPEIQEVIDLYNEARMAMSVNANTAAAMCCRKLLMNMAVKKGAKEGGTFKNYVQYFLKNNYIHEDFRHWVEFIKDKGNEANHEIPEISRADAEKMITFVGMLIKILYEYNAKMKEASNGVDTT